MSDKTTTELWKAVGGWGEPSKMPCHSYGISARECKTGSKLRKIETSVCSRCYARRGNFNWPHIANVYDIRKTAMETDPNWVSNMVELFKRKTPQYFRWFETGDLQSLKMLEDIVSIIKQTPATKHWLPTREYTFVREYVAKHGKFPSNVVIRLSAYMIDKAGPNALAKKLGICTSGVSKAGKHNCPAPEQDNECRACRKCWDIECKNVVYKYH